MLADKGVDPKTIAPTIFFYKVDANTVDNSTNITTQFDIFTNITIDFLLKDRNYCISFWPQADHRWLMANVDDP